MRTVSIGNMIKSLDGILGTKDLNEWETGFVESMVIKTGVGADTSRLTDDQVQTVESLWQKHFS